MKQTNTNKTVTFGQYRTYLLNKAVREQNKELADYAKSVSTKNLKRRFKAEFGV